MLNKILTHFYKTANKFDEKIRKKKFFLSRAEATL